jgi:hypothetical protein
MFNAELDEPWSPATNPALTGTLEAWLAEASAPQAMFHRCACGCRFRWPADAQRVEFRAPDGAVEEVHELAECPNCGSTRSRILAEPWPRVYFDGVADRDDEGPDSEGSGSS